MTNDPKFTPGPWKLAYDKGDMAGTFTLHLGIEDYCVNEVVLYESFWATDGGKRRKDWVEAKANAHLIAAAPELYEALHNMVVLARPLFSDETQMLALELANAALAKARGKS